EPIAANIINISTFNSLFAIVSSIPSFALANPPTVKAIIWKVIHSVGDKEPFKAHVIRINNPLKSAAINSLCSLRRLKKAILDEPLFLMLTERTCSILVSIAVLHYLLFIIIINKYLLLYYHYYIICQEIFYKTGNKSCLGMIFIIIYL